MISVKQYHNTGPLASKAKQYQLA